MRRIPTVFGYMEDGQPCIELGCPSSPIQEIHPEGYQCIEMGNPEQMFEPWQDQEQIKAIVGACFPQQGRIRGGMENTSLCQDAAKRMSCAYDEQGRPRTQAHPSQECQSLWQTYQQNPNVFPASWPPASLQPKNNPQYSAVDLVLSATLWGLAGYGMYRFVTRNRKP